MVVTATGEVTRHEGEGGILRRLPRAVLPWSHPVPAQASSLRLQVLEIREAGGIGNLEPQGPHGRHAIEKRVAPRLHPHPAVLGEARYGIGPLQQVDAVGRRHPFAVGVHNRPRAFIADHCLLEVREGLDSFGLEAGGPQVAEPLARRDAGPAPAARWARQLNHGNATVSGCALLTQPPERGRDGKARYRRLGRVHGSTDPEHPTPPHPLQR